MKWSSCSLSPEEDVLIIGGEDDDLDDLMPGDLWFRFQQRRATNECNIKSSRRNQLRKLAILSRVYR